MKAPAGVEDTSMARVPTFSVVIPSFNNAATIGSAIRSVLRQTRSDFELIVVDDASTDATRHLVEGFLDDERVTLVTRDVNGGQSAARNTGITRARGTFVCFLDSDDLWLPAYLEMMAKTLETTPHAAVAYTDAWVLYDGLGRILRRTAMEAYRPSVTPVDPAAFLLALLEYGNFVYYSITARRDALQGVGGYDEALRGAPDYELWLRLCAAGHLFVRCSETLGIYRRRQGQLTGDAEFKARASAKIFQVVLEEHDLSEEARRIASRRAAEYERAATLGPSSRRRLPIFSGPDGALARLRWFYRRPPASVRDAFPNLNEI
jgi:glycosyltransferase involved in cell wall biosynthesis